MTTRLSNGTKGQSLSQLLGLLNNVCRFVDLPVKDRSRLLALWNNKFPPDLVKSFSILGTYELALDEPASQDHMRWVTMVGGRLISARIDSDDLSPIDRAKIVAGEIQQALSLNTKPGRAIAKGIGITTGRPGERVNQDCVPALEITPEYLCEHLGQQDGKAMLEWMQTCATMFPELRSANKVLQDIFSMANTAGQIKRMVPDLMQYLPEKQRAAFEEQKRSSTIPFEWAPYDKSRIDDMLLQVSKGHLLSNMNREGNARVVRHLHFQTWAAPCEWVPA